MPITLTTLNSSFSSVDSSAYVSSTYTPTANNLLLAVVGVRKAVAGGFTSVILSGNGATWVQVAKATGADQADLRVFRAMSSAPVSGALTISLDTVAQGAVWDILQFSGISTASTDGVDAIVQSVATTFPSVTTLCAISLAGFGTSTANVSFGAFQLNNAGALWTTGGNGEVLLFTNKPGAENVFSIGTFWNPTTRTTMSANNASSVQAKAGIALEIRALTTQTFNLSGSLDMSFNVAASPVVLYQPSGSLDMRFDLAATLQRILQPSGSLDMRFDIPGGALSPQKNVSGSLDMSFNLLGALARGLQKSVMEAKTSGTLRVGLSDDDYRRLGGIVEMLLNTTSPADFRTQTVGTARNTFDLSTLANARYLIVEPVATNTVPMRLGVGSTATGIPISSQGFSVFTLESGDPGELVLYTTQANSTSEARVVVL